MVLSYRQHTISVMINVPEEVGQILKTATNEEMVLFDIYRDLIDGFGAEEIERRLLIKEKDEVIKRAVYKFIEIYYKEDDLR